MFSIIQNFICTKMERLDKLKENVPRLGDVFKEYPFFVNYNSTANFNEVYSIYKQYIPNLNFYNNLTEDWASVTLSLANEIHTPYLIYLCEDSLVNSSKEKIQSCLNEYVVDEYDYLLLTKINKYLREQYVNGGYTLFDNIVRPPYKKVLHGYSYLGKDAPHRRISTDAVYRTDWYRERLEEFILNVDFCIDRMNAKSKKTPNCYEEFYDFYNGMVKFPNLKCYIPNEPLFIEFEGIKQDTIWDNKR